MRLLLVSLILVASGFVPALAIARRVALALVLSPLVASVIVTFAGVAAVVLSASTVVVAAVLVVVAQVVGLLALNRWPPKGIESTELLWLLAFGIAIAYPMTALRTVSIQWDARNIWFLHARWFYAGGSYVWHALANPLAGAHSDYPPLVPAAVGVLWRLDGQVNERTGQLAVGFLTFSVVALLGVMFYRTFGRVRVAAVCLAVGIGLAAFGYSGASATYGYADLLWSAAAAVAVLSLLVAPRDSTSALIGVVALFVASYTKNEGTSVAFVVAVLAIARYRDSIRKAPALLLLLPALLAWPALTRVRGVHAEFTTHATLQLLSGDPQIWNRLGPTLQAISDQCRGIAIVAIICTGLGVLALRKVRSELGLGSTAYSWTVVVAYVGWLAAAYMTSSERLHQHLITSISRTTIAIRLLLLLEIGCWTATGFIALWSQLALRRRGSAVSVDGVATVGATETVTAPQ